MLDRKNINKTAQLSNNGKNIMVNKVLKPLEIKVNYQYIWNIFELQDAISIS